MYFIMNVLKLNKLITKMALIIFSEKPKIKFEAPPSNEVILINVEKKIQKNVNNIIIKLLRVNVIFFFFII